MKTLAVIAAMTLAGCRTVSVSNVYVQDHASATITYTGTGTGTQAADKTLKDSLSGNQATVPIGGVE